jgi:hypothetical protein
MEMPEMLAAPRGHGSDGVPWEKYGTNTVKIWENGDGI